MIWSMVALAFAVSLDGLGAGMMYGMRKIKMPATSILIVSVCSGLVLFASMAVGRSLAVWLPETAAKWIGALILMAIGCWAMIQMSLTSRREREKSPAVGVEEERRIFQWEIRQLGIIIHIWKTPSLADMDRSGRISGAEAVLLGIALSLDSLGAGIGAALIGLPAAPSSLLIAGTCGLCIAVGARIGYVCSGWSWINKLAVVPGFILIMMGIMRLM